jgi:hypothetical protein
MKAAEETKALTVYLSMVGSTRSLRLEDSTLEGADCSRRSLARVFVAIRGALGVDSDSSGLFVGVSDRA